MRSEQTANDKAIRPPTEVAPEKPKSEDPKVVVNTKKRPR